MATASTSLLPLTGTPLDAALIGAYWQLDQSRTITWALGDNETYIWSDPSLSAAVISAALGEYEKFLDVHFQYIGQTRWNTSPADITFNIGDSSLLGASTTEARAIFPNLSLADTTIAAFGLSRSQYQHAEGDIWFNNDFSAQAFQYHDKGSQVFYMAMHEIGHALGLKHPHDDGGTGHPTYAQVGAVDSPFLTVMSYGTPPGSTMAAGWPATPGVNEVSALQYLYGANRWTAAGNTSYQLTATSPFQTIYDAGGTDKLDVSTFSTAFVLDLRPGFLSGQASSARPCFGISYGTVIEDAIAGSGADTINGNDGPNRIQGGGGNDSIYGGPGIDTAIYRGLRSQYVLQQSSTSLSVSDVSSGRDGTDTLTGVERLQFADCILAFDTAGDAGQGFRLYQAAFNRTPDKSGLSFWVHALDTGTSLHDVAVGFVNSAEFKAVYGAGASNAQIVDKLYHNVLGRAGEQGGTDYWIGKLQAGTSVADVLANFSESPENVAKVAPLIGTGISLEPGFFA
ncbi:DUF4214 domain-containing protein [Alsobacter sp. KACC 23698]|uniref:DUF4214 domain-containing protein n=1 Tax=Alsobacter sp. KACC 23698 TaxID=3149229 RepID=A0AAU7JCN6_9HYPH